jgi:hypothetical protein
MSEPTGISGGGVRLSESAMEDYLKAAEKHRQTEYAVSLFRPPIMVTKLQSAKNNDTYHCNVQWTDSGKWEWFIFCKVQAGDARIRHTQKFGVADSYEDACFAAYSTVEEMSREG